jgi:SAM-dependent MidA family methyltransferase
MIVCCEWLDDLPCRVVHREADGWREVVVDKGGDQRPGPRLVEEDLDWADRWWPTGQRAEIGSTRDRAWSVLSAAVRRRGGCAVMIDYGHQQPERPADGTFAAYRDGRSVEPMPSAGVNLTAHVSVDSVRSAGESAGLSTVLCCRQGEAMARLGSPSPADPEPLADLSRRSERAALTAPYGWGSHWWLVQA